METIRTLAELDRRLDAAEQAAKWSSDEFRRILDGFVLDPKSLIGEIPRDPRSEEYRGQQMRMYGLLADRDYEVENERTPFDHQRAMRWPFPYSTRSAQQVGNYLMTYGSIIKAMNLDKDARVLEVGSGFGPLTHHLASMGHNITCVDMDASLLEYVRERTRGLPGQVDTVLADMNTFTLDDSFDAILFFESFHHCADHIGLLKRLSRMLEPGGQLVLAGEPIVPSGSVAVPYPWGIRMDGLSLWSIRKHGWLELGFQEMYLRTLLEDTGWNVTASTAPTESVMGVWLCRAENDAAHAPSSRLEPLEEWTAEGPALSTQAGRRSGSAIVSTGQAGYLQYGPYVPMEPGLYEVTWEGRARSGKARFDVAFAGGQRVLRAAEVSFSGRDHDGNALAHLRFRITERIADLEFRVYVDPDVEMEISRIVLGMRRTDA